MGTDSIEAHREFAGTSLKELTIPLVEDKTGEISRAFGVFDLTTHTAVPTLHPRRGGRAHGLLHHQHPGGGLCRGGGEGGGCLQRVRHIWCLVPPAQGHLSHLAAW